MSIRGAIIRLRSAFGWVGFSLVRAMDALLPPTGLRLLLWPVALVLALLPVQFAKELSARLKFHLARPLCFLPDRLAAPRWQERCQLRGFEPVRAALAAGRPVVLATLHFGPLPLMRYWLRAGGIPVATLVGESTAERNAIRRHKDALSDRASGLEMFPHVIARDNLRDALRLLERPAALMVAMDFQSGRAVEVDDGTAVIRLGSGAIRMAARAGALLVPCLIRETEPWRFEIRCGQPVPETAVSSNEPGKAAAHLWREFSREVRAHPEDGGVELRACQHPAARTQTEPAVETATP